MELLTWLSNRFLRQKYPFPVVDMITKYYNGKKFQGIVLVERKNFPKGWAIPGGFVEYGESCENAAIREAKEETGLNIEIIKQLGTFSDPKRDPRIHTISTVFLCKAKGKIISGSDAKKAKVFSLKEAEKMKLCFDHSKILKDSIKEIERNAKK